MRREQETHPSSLSHDPGGLQVWFPMWCHVPGQERWCWRAPQESWQPLQSVLGHGAKMASVLLACPQCILGKTGGGAPLVLSASGSSSHSSFCPSFFLCSTSSIQSRYFAPAKGFPVPREGPLCPISHHDYSWLPPSL